MNECISETKDYKQFSTTRAILEGLRNPDFFKDSKNPKKGIPLTRNTIYEMLIKKMGRNDPRNSSNNSINYLLKKEILIEGYEGFSLTPKFDIIVGNSRFDLI